MGITVSNVHKIDVNQYPKISGIFIGEIVSSPILSKKIIKFEIKILKTQDSLVKFPGDSKVFLYAELSDSTTLPLIADIILFKGEIDTPDQPLNPGEFNYAEYLKRNGIHYKTFVKHSNWKIIGHSKKFSVIAFAGKVSQLLQERISSVKPQDPSLNVLFTLTLGTKGLIDRETRESYSSSGITHVLSVSGLHVALIWMVISKIFFFLKKIRFGNYLYFSIIILMLWFYAVITGLSPPVVRSAIMLSIVILGQFISKNSPIYNSIFIAAFFSLYFRPEWLDDIGFQLSYTAVLGIVFFQPLIKSIFTPNYRIIKWIWDLTSVSIAAQIGTLPVSLYNFHRFPLYFLPANLIIIPLVTLILCIFIVQIFSILIPVIFSFISNIQFFLVELMNTLVKIFENLPSPDMNNIFIGKQQMWCLLAVIIFSAFYFRYKLNKWLILNLVSLIFFSAFGGYLTWKKNISEHLIVYNTPGNFIMGIYSGGDALLVVNEINSRNLESNILYSCEGFRLKNGYKPPEIISIDKIMKISRKNILFNKLPGERNFICRFMDKRIIFLNDPEYYYSYNSPVIFKSDFIIFNSLKKVKMDMISKIFSAESIILSGNIPDYINYISDKNSEFHTTNIHDCRRAGAFILSRKLENQFFRLFKNYPKNLFNS